MMAIPMGWPGKWNGAADDGVAEYIDGNRITHMCGDGAVAGVGVFGAGEHSRAAGGAGARAFGRGALAAIGRPAGNQSLEPGHRPAVAPTGRTSPAPARSLRPGQPPLSPVPQTAG